MEGFGLRGWGRVLQVGDGYDSFGPRVGCMHGLVGSISVASGLVMTQSAFACVQQGTWLDGVERHDCILGEDILCISCSCEWYST